MQIEENIEIINQMMEHQRKIERLTQQLREGEAQVLVCTLGYGGVHIFSGIDVLAKAFDCVLDACLLTNYGGVGEVPYPYRVSFGKDGVDYYQVMSCDEYRAFAANCIVPIRREVSA